jgi:hypothetical protein
MANATKQVTFHIDFPRYLDKDEVRELCIYLASSLEGKCNVIMANITQEIIFGNQNPDFFTEPKTKKYRDDHVGKIKRTKDNTEITYEFMLKPRSNNEKIFYSGIELRYDQGNYEESTIPQSELTRNTRDKILHYFAKK